MEKNKILVTWDFTELADFALAHAFRFASVTDNEIALIHIVKKEKEIEEATEKLNRVVDEAHKKYGKRPIPIVKEGSIFTTIGEVADEIDANLVIMGTHGIRGMQKLTGSWALKVITSSKVPFVVVQAPPLAEKYENIVFPIDFKSENKEKLNWINYLSKYYKLKVRIVKPKITDEILLKKTNNNLIFTKKILDSKGIDYDITTSDLTDLSAASIDFAVKIKADLVLIMTTRDIDIKDFVFGATEEKIIANSAKVSVMVVNPNDENRKFSSFY